MTSFEIQKFLVLLNQAIGIANKHNIATATNLLRQEMSSLLKKVEDVCDSM